MPANSSKMRGGWRASTSTLSLFELLGGGNGLVEFILMYWWAILVGNLLLFAFAKHSLMRWELRQDRRRLECCYFRHCQRRRAARELRNAASVLAHHTHSDAAAHDTGAHAMASLPACRESAKSEGASTPVDKAKKREAKQLGLFLPELSVTEPAKVAASRKLAEDRVRTALGSSLDGLLGETAGVTEDCSRPPPLMLPLSSAASSDLSITSSSSPSATHTTSSATARLLKKFSFMSQDASQISGDRFDNGRHSNSSNASSRFSSCCPRYSEDEQRLIDKKRQENVRAWMEAKRALELTDSLAAGSRTIKLLASVASPDSPP
ncbi:hypothetical protein LSCM1_01194 [Leishmania martiniquensis]|uniref:Uncharacterized protein n=1 Tax=Leishmania martiniquensis TaxID=1580590 RepID=A0A836KDP1_9TRYP|nr:hypothetical protein LSCM1_01194 [Leishmania martiniquensis]